MVMDEHPFMKALLLALGSQPWCRVWRQNCGGVLVRDARGRVQRRFDAGPPAGVADISGFTRPDGWRLEIEVKAAGGRRAPNQIRFAELARANGVVHVFVEYDEELSLAQNVERAVELVQQAITERRARAA
ncbi:hypothetical protein [Pendulispora albinea]|uniref:VRR-NUC domain-containing protein n=1 Tax=Pendulispora albinea TaxID=2741071 RepID=A0ABZ2LX03_9BACT